MPKNDPCAMATVYADRLSKCKSVEELKHIGGEIKADLKSLVGWEDWLRDCYRSCETTLTAPKLIPAECLNAQGMKALERGEITL